jgi:3',5'-cyclic-nucleotide phosphodiesterase
VDLRVIGCHGGETPRHRTSAFIVDDRIAIDAGSLTSGMELAAQCALDAVLVSHAHLDHIRDLATIADNRTQNDAAPLLVAGTKQTIGILRKHYFNGLLWPDFTKIPNEEKPSIRYVVLKPEVVTDVAGYKVRAILVSHTIECCAFAVECPVARGGGVIASPTSAGTTRRAHWASR